MRSLILSSSFTIAATCVAIACGSNNDVGSPPETDAGLDGALRTDGTLPEDSSAEVESVPAAGVCASSAAKICEFLGSCSPQLVDGLWASPAECVPRFEQNCLAAYPANAELRKDDASSFTDCLAGLTCNDLYGPRWSTACPTPRLKKTKSVDTTCRIDAECESGACTGSSTTCGKCVKRLEAGASCTDRAQCPRGGACNDENCIAPAFLGDACDSNNVCGNALVCTDGKCVKGGGVGAPCTNDLQCDLPAFVSCNSETKKCEASSFVEPGGTCPAASSGTPALCMKGSDCIHSQPGEPGVCVAPAKVGEACGSEKSCEHFVNCRNGTCVLPTYVPCL